MSDDAVAEFVDDEKRLCGLVVDFDNAFIDGISVFEKTIGKVFEEKGLDYNKGIFMRKILGGRVQHVLSMISKADGEAKPEEVLEELYSKMDKAIDEAQVNPVVLDICAKTLAEGGRVVFVTFHAVEVVKRKIAEHGLEDALVYKAERNDRFTDFPKDSWAKASRMIKLNPRSSTAFVATSKGAKNTIYAGMHTVAFPSELTSFQDFSGSDFIVEPDSNDDGLPEKILDLMSMRLD